MYKRNLREINELRSLKNNIRVVGLTGGIASGKTIATAALEKAGYTVIDADEISRALFGKGTDGEKMLSSLFPAADRSGTLDRARLRQIISTSDDARKKLNAATHPEIVREITKLLEQRADAPTVLSAPLLFESGLSALCDCTVCVTCPTRIRTKRLMERDGVTREQATAMIKAQIPDAYRATLSDFCIPSDRNADEFRAEIVELFQTLFGIKKP